MFSFLLTVLFLTSPLAAILTPDVVSSPAIEISSDESLLDQKIEIGIKKLKPMEIILVEAHTIDDNNTKWISYGTFQADTCGIVDLSKQPPIKGSYEGIDSLGLLWSMQPESGQAASFKIKKDKFSVHFKIHPENTLNSFLEGMKDEKAFNDAAIPVEKIQAALLVISGGDDQMWPSSLYASQIEKRLKNNHSPILFEHLYYAKAGHGINISNFPQPGVYYHPIGKKWFTLGGSIADDQYASQDSWEKLIQFFQKTLKSNPSQP